MTYSPSPVLRPDLQIISPLSEESLGIRAARNIGLGAPASITWVANLAVFVPFSINIPFVVKEVIWYNGSAVVSNIDVGVYTSTGTRLFNLGSTAQGTASVPVNSTTLTDYALDVGDYYMAFACNGTTNAVTGWAPAAPLGAGIGIGQMATAFALPSNATIVPLTNAVVPFFGLNGYTVAV